jgi:hypothetical protein
MFKYLFLSLSIVVPSLTFAHHHKCDHVHRGHGEIEWLCDGEGLGRASLPSSIFTMAGKICAGPAFDSNGELITSYRGHAEKLADKGAEYKCYPYQVHRESKYKYENWNADCSSSNPYTVKETVTANYSCAPAD